MIKNFDYDNKLIHKQFYKISDNQKSLDIDEFCIRIFPNIPIKKCKILSYINEFYKIHQKSYILTDKLNLDDFFTIACILTNVNKTEEDKYLNDNDKSSFDILYEIFIGKFNSSQENHLDFEIIKIICDMIIEIYIHTDGISDEIKNTLNPENFTEFLKISLKCNGKVVEKSLLKEFLNKLTNIENYLISYFRIKFYGLESSETIILPIPNNLGEIPVELFLFFCLANPHINKRKYAFNLFDHRKDGFCIFSAVNSFVGFGGPVAIIIKHLDKQTKLEYILGGYVNSNITVDRMSGDENSFVFSLYPFLQIYKFVDNKQKVAFFTSKSSHTSNERKPGIGFGDYHGKYRLWIDAKDTSHQSYFMKFDNVFEDGSPFEDAQEFLDITCIQIFGFGDEDDYNQLMKKQNKDKIIIGKMRKIDKKMMLENDFDKDILLSNTFSHRQYGSSSNMDT